MDPSIAQPAITPPTPEPTPKVPAKPKINLKIILGGFSILILVFTALIYLKVIPIQINLNPKVNQTVPALPTPEPTAIPKISVACPVPAQFCNTGKVIAEKDFYAIAFALPKGTEIYSSFQGTLDNKPKIEKRPANQPYLYLRDERGYEAIYSYFGTSAPNTFTKLEQGTKIGTIGEGAFPSIVSFGGSNFVLAVKNNGKFIPFEIK